MLTYVLTSIPNKTFQADNTIVPVSPPSRILSYKKTVFTKPLTPPKPNKGYDREAHDSLVKDYNMPTPSFNYFYLFVSNPDVNEGLILDQIQ